MKFEFNRLGRLRSELNIRRRKKGRRILLAGGILVLLVPVCLLLISSESESPGPPSIESVQQESNEPGHQIIEGRVEEKGTLYRSLSEKKIPLRWIDLIISELKAHMDFKRIKGGAYRFIVDMKGEMIRFVYEAGPTEVYEVKKDPSGYSAQKLDVPTESYVVKVVGEIRSSLFEAVDAAGEQDSLTLAFAELLEWEIDFYKDLKEGDRFKVVIEKIFKGKDFIRYGPIYALEYLGAEKNVKGIRYQNDYYDEKGKSLKKALLKAPLRFSRISSQFSRARRHPILGGLRPHLGTDYAAPPGMPVWAVGDGVVVSCRWNGGYGKQVVLRHMNGCTTFYSHLSRYGPGIRAGSRVRQKQIIGFVGSTGLSTGPHLDYRLGKDGNFKNPLLENSPGGLPVAKGEWEGFRKTRDEMIERLQGDEPSKQLQSPLASGEGERN